MGHPEFAGLEGCNPIRYSSSLYLHMYASPPLTCTIPKLEGNSILQRELDVVSLLSIFASNLC